MLIVEATDLDSPGSVADQNRRWYAAAYRAGHRYLGRGLTRRVREFPPYATFLAANANILLTGWRVVEITGEVE